MSKVSFNAIAQSDSLIPPTAARRQRARGEDVNLAAKIVEPFTLLNDDQTAVKLGISPATLRSWRCRGIGPPYIKLGQSTNASVRYNPIDLDEFLSQGRHVPSVRAASEE
jgi:hypothetical protein